MENHKKHHRQVKQKQKQKQRFFDEVFQGCKNNFTDKQFEFFVKCNMTNRHSINTSISIKNLIHHQDKETNINQIHPQLMTMGRKFDSQFGGVRDCANREKKNQRLLTTPTERISRENRLNYEDYVFYKHLQKCKDNMGIKCKKSHKKMYSPEPLFNPTSRYQPRKLSLMRSSQIKYRSKTKPNHYKIRLQWSESEKEKEKQNLELIPWNFVEIVNQSSRKQTRTRTMGNFKCTMRRVSRI